MHGVSDFLIAIAYLTIPVVIVKAVNRRPDLLDPRVARLFAAFITACALSHLAGLLTLWVPAYGLQGVVKIATAAVSIYTAVQLTRLLPSFLAMPSHAEMAHKEAEISMEQQRTASAQQQNDRLGEFAHIVSHDLKAPMRGISNQAQFLAEDHGDSLPPEALRRLARIQQLCAQLENLVSTVLKYSRIGRQTSRKLVSTEQVVGEVTTALAEFMADCNGRVVLQGPLPAIEADATEMAAVFRNLIVNGLTYNTSDAKQIEIGYHDQIEVSGQLMRQVFSVADNGIGIDAEFHQDIYRMFKRLNADPKFGEGTGAGLSFVKKILEAGRGAVALSSAPGKGSVFYISFGPGAAATAPEVDHHAEGMKHA